MAEATKPKPAPPPAAKLQRSPPYPYVPLSKAVERAKDLYPQSQHHQVGANVLAHAWGYSPTSSGVIQTAAALMQFGLLTDEGSGDKRKFQLTPEAIRIVQDADPASEKRKSAIQRAALLPKIHKELWDKYGTGDVSDVLLQNYLTLDRMEAGQSPFNSVAATALIEEYKETVTYAGLSKTSGAPDPGGDKLGEIRQEDTTFVPPPANNAPLRPAVPTHKREVTLMQNERELTTGMLSKDASFRLVVSGTVGVKEIERLIKKLELDKEILAEQEMDELLQ